MSQSNAAAIKRRVNAVQQPSIPPSNQFKGTQQSQQSNVNANANINTNILPNQPSQGLTLPQVIAVMDKRLINLETFMKESTTSKNLEHIVSKPSKNDEPVFNNNVIEEINMRFDLLAAEFDAMKDIILKLQSFTMDVNKTLLDERVHIFSELGNGGNSPNDNKIDLSLQETSTIVENSINNIPEILELQENTIQKE